MDAAGKAMGYLALETPNLAPTPLTSGGHRA